MVVDWSCVWSRWGDADRRRAVLKEAVSYDAQNIYGHSHFRGDEKIAEAGAFKKGPILGGFTAQSQRAIYYNPGKASTSHHRVRRHGARSESTGIARHSGDDR